MKRAIAVLGTYALLLALVTATRFADAQESPSALERRVAQLEDLVKQLDKRVRQLEERNTPIISVPPSKAAWRQLRTGMTFSEVRALLGEPGKVATYEVFVCWYYPDILDGEVRFKPEGHVISWREP